MKGTVQLLPLARGDADRLRQALLKLYACVDRQAEGVQVLLKRLADDPIAGEELAILRRLVENERTLCLLIIQQRASGSVADSNAAKLNTLDSLKAKLGCFASVNEESPTRSDTRVGRDELSPTDDRP